MHRPCGQVDAADPALPVRWRRPLEGEAPKAHRGWVTAMRFAQHAQQSDAFGWQRRLELDALAAGRVIECQAPRVQEHALEAHPGQALAAGQLPVQLEVAV